MESHDPSHDQSHDVPEVQRAAGESDPTIELPDDEVCHIPVPLLFHFLIFHSRIVSQSSPRILPYSLIFHSSIPFSRVSFSHFNSFILYIIYCITFQIPCDSILLCFVLTFHFSHISFVHCIAFRLFRISF